MAWTETESCGSKAHNREPGFSREAQRLTLKPKAVAQTRTVGDQGSVAKHNGSDRAWKLWLKGAQQANWQNPNSHMKRCNEAKTNYKEIKYR